MNRFYNMYKIIMEEQARQKAFMLRLEQEKRIIRIIKKEIEKKSSKK